jgi:hypothetical protein
MSAPILTAGSIVTFPSVPIDPTDAENTGKTVASIIADLSGNYTVPVQQTATSLIPILSSNSQDGYVLTTNDTFNGGGFEMWRAFDGMSSTEWAYDTAVHPAWLQIQLPSAKTVTYCKVSSRAGYANQSITNAVLQGSNDASAWTTLTSNIDVSTTQIQYRLEQFSVTSPASYLYYRLYITATQPTQYSGSSTIELWGY